MANGFTLGDPEFRATSQLHAYCNNGRKQLHPLAGELHVASEELKAILSNVSVAGMDEGYARSSARTVASHLDHAAEAVDQAAESIVRAWQSFDRNFLHYQPPRNKTFDLEK